MDLKLSEHLKALPGPILITGHTGFKGSWLTFVLQFLNIPTIGYSLAPMKNSLYDRAKMAGRIPEIYGDIRNSETFRKFLEIHKPSAIIHMAAQPLVLRSYELPKETFDVNVMGTVNILDQAFATNFVQAVVVVTTDKVYRNNELGQAFVESDPLEGKDPYSSSKVGTEAAVSAWQQIQRVSGGPKVVSVRAGNVVGGGDWAQDRLIPDLIRGFASGKPVRIRNSMSSRPWQHVLDPLVGYLMTLEHLLASKRNIVSINFAPGGKNLTVKDVAMLAQTYWGGDPLIEFSKVQEIKEYETTSLSLDASYAFELLKLKDNWSQELAVKKSIIWWKKLIQQDITARECINSDLIEYFS